jgi:hypothetical protein
MGYSQPFLVYLGNYFCSMREAIVISTRAIGGLGDNEFYHFCQDNRDLTFERDADGKIILMPNTGGKTAN